MDPIAILVITLFVWWVVMRPLHKAFVGRGGEPLFGCLKWAVLIAGIGYAAVRLSSGIFAASSASAWIPVALAVLAVLVVGYVTVKGVSIDPDDDFNKALASYRQLEWLEGYERRKALYRVVAGCQNSIARHRHFGDAYVLLADAYTHIAIAHNPDRPDPDMSMRAARVAAYWRDNAHALRTGPSSAASAVTVERRAAELTSQSLGTSAFDAMSRVVAMPPGQLQDALNDRLSVGTFLMPEDYARMSLR